MIIWSPDTCYCVIICKSPSVNGKYLKRCKVHRGSKNTTDCYTHNISKQERNDSNEDSREQKKRQTKESTKP